MLMMETFPMSTLDKCVRDDIWFVNKLNILPQESISGRCSKLSFNRDISCRSNQTKLSYVILN